VLSAGKCFPRLRSIQPQGLHQLKQSKQGKQVKQAKQVKRTNRSKRAKVASLTGRLLGVSRGWGWRFRYCVGRPRVGQQRVGRVVRRST
jgi:hypothetical protein